MDLSRPVLIPGERAWLALLLVAVLCYLTGLDSLYLPSNGDEMVYSHIARLTAQSGHWLPLVSDLDHMRNTKPPLLFWQAMLAGDWGAHWQLWRLRLPAALFSLCISLGVAACTWRLTRRRDLAWLAACVYLAFFSSFRYGRPYLTSAAETFLLALPLFVVLWRRQALPGYLVFAALGLAWGLGLLYKSFALVLPAGAGLWCALLALHWHGDWKSFWAITWRVKVAGWVALVVFGLWFVLDPDPQAVWQEFVLGENGGKLAASRLPFPKLALAVTVQALAWLENAGPLALVMFGLMGLGVMRLSSGLKAVVNGGLRSLNSLSESDRSQLALALWALVWLMVFCLPSQRSARYVIPAMPALAVLMAMHWQRLARGWFVATLLLCLPVLLLLGRIAQAMHDLEVASDAEWALAALLCLVSLVLLLTGLLRARWARLAALACSLGLYALLNATLTPLTGAAGRFALGDLSAGQRVAVPSTFNAQYERYQFLLPNAAQLRIAPYAPIAPIAPGAPTATDAPDAVSKQLAQLLQDHDLVLWQAAQAPCAPGPGPHCRVLASRWDLRSRHQSGEIRLDNLFDPAQWLLRREWVLARGS